jgi:hypothetical protein
MGAAACVRPIPPPTPPFIREGQRDRTHGELLNSLDDRSRRFFSLRSLATVSYSGPDGKGTFQEAVLLHRPDRLRLETLSRLGTVLIVVTTGEEVLAFDVREGVYYLGRDSRAAFHRLTRIPLDSRDLISLLLGLPPVGERSSWRAENNRLFSDPAAGVKEVVAFEPSLGVPVYWERLGAAGEILVSAEFMDFIETQAGFFPATIRLASPPAGVNIEIGHDRPELNVELPADLFSFWPPAGARRAPLESFAR